MNLFWCVTWQSNLVYKWPQEKLPTLGFHTHTTALWPMEVFFSIYQVWLSSALPEFSTLSYCACYSWWHWHKFEPNSISPYKSSYFKTSASLRSTKILGQRLLSLQIQPLHIGQLWSKPPEKRLYLQASGFSVLNQKSCHLNCISDNFLKTHPRRSSTGYCSTKFSFNLLHF